MKTVNSVENNIATFYLLPRKMDYAQRFVCLVSSLHQEMVQKPTEELEKEPALNLGNNES